MSTDTTTTRQPDVSMTAVEALRELERLEEARRAGLDAAMSALGAGRGVVGPIAPLSMRAERWEAVAEAEREVMRHWSAVSRAACYVGKLGAMDRHVRSLLIAAAGDAEHAARLGAAKYADHAEDLRRRAADRQQMETSGRPA